MNQPLALSEVFATKVRLRVDPLLADHGFRRIEGGSWHRAAYENGSRYVVLDVHLDPSDGPRWLRVMLGEGAPSAPGGAGGGRSLEAFGGQPRYLLPSAASLNDAFDQILGDLVSHAGSFLRGVGEWTPAPVAVHPLLIGA
jgi:hypothetical protein